MLFVQLPLWFWCKSLLFSKMNHTILPSYGSVDKFSHITNCFIMGWVCVRVSEHACIVHVCGLNTSYICLCIPVNYNYR